MTMKEIRKEVKKHIERVRKYDIEFAEMDTCTMGIFETLYKDGVVRNFDNHFLAFANSFQRKHGYYSNGFSILQTLDLHTIYATKKQTREMICDYFHLLHSDTETVDSPESDTKAEETSSSEATIAEISCAGKDDVKVYYDILTGEFREVIKTGEGSFSSPDKKFKNTFVHSKFTISYNYDFLRCVYHFNYLTSTEMVYLYQHGVNEIEFNGKKYDLIDFISVLMDKEIDESDNFIGKIPTPLMYEKNSFLAKKILIWHYKSDIFKRYATICPLLRRVDLINAIHWLCGDPRDKNGHTTRAITITPNGIKMLKKVNCLTFTNLFELIGGKKWIGEYRDFKAETEKEKMFADENGFLHVLDKSYITADNKI